MKTFVVTVFSLFLSIASAAPLDKVSATNKCYQVNPIIYLANDYGFSPGQSVVVQSIKKGLTDMGYEVWEPFERHTGSNDDPQYRIINV